MMDDKVPKINTGEPMTLRVEIDIHTMRRLFSTQNLCARELRCLDYQTKQIVQQLCLQVCASALKVEDR